MLTNNKIARILYEIAEMLEILGESRFRIVAYQKAAQIIENLADDVIDIYVQKGEEGLIKIKGIGKSIADKIVELIKTGKINYYQDLIKKVPSSELNLMKIPGIGPKTASKLYHYFKIKNLNELEKLARRGEIRKLPGFNILSEKNILENIRRLKKREKRLLISFAEPIAYECLNSLKKCKYVKKVDIVGSLRRMKETIGDIDLVASSSKPSLVINYFINLPFVKKVENHGKTKASIIHQKDVAVDLEILPPDSYGSLLQHLTGSREHNIHLRKLANDKGLSLSEYGITYLKNNRLEKIRDEKIIYQKLGLSYIVPELREDWGEIEAAMKNNLPHLISLKDIKGDLHIHTNWSEGTEDITSMVNYCLKKGYSYLAITDHTKGLGIASGMDEKKILNQIREIEKIRQKITQIEIFTGAEVNIKADGSLDIDNDILSRLDIVIASIHSSFYQSEEKMTQRLIKAIKNPFVKIIGHPSGRLIKKRDSYEVDWPLVFQEAYKNNVALEINSFPERLDLRDFLVKEAKSYGVKFAINTDAHRSEHLQQIRYGVAVARRGWLEKKDVINTWSTNKLKRWLTIKK